MSNLPLTGMKAPYRHFWRCQFEKLVVGGFLAGLILFITFFPDHPWGDDLKVLASQAGVILLWMMKGTWKNPKNGNGEQPED